MSISKAVFTFKSDELGHVMYETGETIMDDYSHGGGVPKGQWSSVSKSLPLQMYSIGLDGFAVTFLSHVV